MSEKELWDQGIQVTLLIHEGAIVLHVAQAATDVLEVSNKAIETEVTSEVDVMDALFRIYF